ncbi:Exonuclease mut-7 [Phlyctochytrium bullatum]|nr:Exonuclease mut-7 [Phlyctochytrium bullatum]
MALVSLLPPALRTNDPHRVLATVTSHHLQPPPVSAKGPRPRPVLMGAPVTRTTPVHEALRSLDDPVGFCIRIAAAITEKDYGASGKPEDTAGVRRIVKTVAGLCCMAVSVVSDQDIPRALLARYFNMENHPLGGRATADDGDGEAESSKKRGKKRKSQAITDDATPAESNDQPAEKRLRSDVETAPEANEDTISAPVTSDPIPEESPTHLTITHARAELLALFKSFSTTTSGSKTARVHPLVPFHLSPPLGLDLLNHADHISPLLTALAAHYAFAESAALVQAYVQLGKPVLTELVAVVETMVINDDLQNAAIAVGEAETQVRETLIGLLEKRCEEGIKQIDAADGWLPPKEQASRLVRLASHTCTLVFRLGLATTDEEARRLVPHAAAGCLRGRVGWLAAETAGVVKGVVRQDDEDAEAWRRRAGEEAEGPVELLEKVVKGAGERFERSLVKCAIGTLVGHADGEDHPVSVIAETFAKQHNLQDFLTALRPSQPHSSHRTSKPPKHLSLPSYSPPVPITVVTTSAELEPLANAVRGIPNAATGLQGAVVAAALDTEWMPDVVTLTGSPEAGGRAAIVQVGVEDGAGGRHAFVIVLKELGNEVAEVLGTLFNSKKIKKLGFSFEQDLSKLRSSHPTLPSAIKNMKDLSRTPRADFAKHLHPGFLACGGDANVVRSGGKAKFGLADACAWVLGRRLGKAARISDWEKKGLSEAQVRYAANDVLVLLDIYRVLKGKDGDDGSKDKADE